MNINRHNYESYFLLYIDKELSGAEMRAVEEFVEQNADLKSELDQWQLSVLEVEECAYGNKEQLFKKETITAEEEANLILLVDGELSEEDTFLLKKSISSNKGLAKEWELIQHTKLVDEADCIFENKELLYRKEEKVRPVYFITRWAVAAALLGMGLYAGFQIFNQDETSLPTPVAVENRSESLNSSSGLPEPMITALNKSDDNNVKTSADKEEQNDEIVTAVAEKISANNVKQAENNKPENFRNLTADNIDKTKDDTKYLLAANIKQVKIKKIEAPDGSPDLIEKLSVKRPDLIDINITETQTNRNAIRTAFNNNTNNDRILYMDKEVVEKTKVGKFLKKVKHTLYRDIEIESGRTIKIAGFEIALQ